MEERLEDLLARGYTREDAVNTVLDDFGDAAALAGEFGRIGTRRRWIMRTTAGIFGIAAAVLLVSFLLPENRPLPAPSYSHADENEAEFVTAAAVRPSSPAAARDTSYGLGAFANPESEADRETRSKLAHKMGEISFPEGTSLEEVLNFLREEGQVPVSVNWNAMSVMGIDRDTDIQGLRLRNVRLETALDILLQNVGAVEAPLSYAIVDGVVRISTEEDLDRNTVVRVYDVHDLVRRDLPAAIRDAISSALSAPRATSPEPGGMGGMGGYGGGGYGGYGGGNSERTLPDIISELEQERVADLEDLIKTTVQPASWRPEGAVGAMSYFDGLLVIVHSPRAQQEIIELLGTMRQALAARSDGESSTPSASTGMIQETPAVRDVPEPLFPSRNGKAPGGNAYKIAPGDTLAHIARERLATPRTTEDQGSVYAGAGAGSSTRPQ